MLPNASSPDAQLHQAPCLPPWKLKFLSQVVSQLFFVVFRVNRKSCSVTGGVLGRQEHVAKWVPKNI